MRQREAQKGSCASKNKAAASTGDLILANHPAMAALTPRACCRGCGRSLQTHVLLLSGTRSLGMPNQCSVRELALSLPRLAMRHNRCDPRTAATYSCSRTRTPSASKSASISNGRAQGAPTLPPPSQLAAVSDDVNDVLWIMHSACMYE